MSYSYRLDPNYHSEDETKKEERMTKDEAFQEFEKATRKIDKEAYEAREKAREVLRARLELLREQAHEELRVIRAMSQKTRKIGEEKRQ